MSKIELIKFKVDNDIDLHEALCKAICEKDLESLEILSQSVSDIDIIDQQITEGKQMNKTQKNKEEVQEKKVDCEKIFKEWENSARSSLWNKKLKDFDCDNFVKLTDDYITDNIDIMLDYFIDDNIITSENCNVNLEEEESLKAIMTIICFDLINYLVNTKIDRNTVRDVIWVPEEENE